MDPILSRRAGRAMTSQTFLALSMDERKRFADAVLKASSFDELPEQYQQLIVQAESESKASDDASEEADDEEESA